MVGSVLSGLKVSAAIAVTRTTTGTFYTAPADGYAIINVFFDMSTSDIAVISIGGVPVCNVNMASGDNSYFPGAYDSASTVIRPTGSTTYYVGPSQSVTGTLTDSPSVSVSGVEFRNAV